MHVLHASNEILASRGGIVTVLASLLPALREQGVDADLVSLTPKNESAAASPLHGPHLHLAHAISVDPFFGFSWELRPLMERLANESSAIHSHGLWFFLHYMAYRVARETDKPHIIAVHGMAQPYIQNRSRWKKRPSTGGSKIAPCNAPTRSKPLSPPKSKTSGVWAFPTPLQLCPTA